MNRRKFIQQFTWLTGGFILAGDLLSTTQGRGIKKVRGSVSSNGRGIANVVISDGYSVVVTNAKGKFEFPAHPAAVSVFISTPAGYAFLQEKKIARHYMLFDGSATKMDFDFKLTPLATNDEEHDFFVWADPQVQNEQDVQRMMNESVPSVQSLVKTYPADALLHGICVGDIVWDKPELFVEYDKAVAAMNIPFFQCLGNHDMDYNKGGDETSDDTFQQNYGPTYYSFNRGKAHYVVMDNVRYLGKDKDYDGFIQQHQLDWLQKDLAFVPKDHLLILCVHIPVHKGTKNNEALYRLLEDRQVHIMSGHTHYMQNVIKGNIYEHNHAAVCGAWWSGDICDDGSPNGYAVYKVKGNQLQWRYQGTGNPVSHQLRAYFKATETGDHLMEVNIWNSDAHWKTEFWVDGVARGSLTRFEGLDALAFKTMQGPTLPAIRSWAEPKITGHLFKAHISSEAKEVRILATDPFGQQYSITEKVAFG